MTLIKREERTDRCECHEQRYYSVKLDFSATSNSQVQRSGSWNKKQWNLDSSMYVVGEVKGTKQTAYNHSARYENNSGEMVRE